MSLIFSRLCGGLFVVMATGVAIADSDAGPTKAAREFYDELKIRKVDGLPQGDAWSALTPLMTESLVKAFQVAHKEQAEFIQQQPDEKPPWIEGDLFSSLFEGPQQFAVGKAKVAGDTASIPVTFTRIEGAETVKWTDTLKLRQMRKVWLVDDVIYQGEWAFGNKGTLRDALAPAPKALSPDGRFEFVTFSVEDNNAGKPPFGIVERVSRRLVWSATDDMGEASRPEAWVLWSPDSNRFALVARVSTRRLATSFFGMEGGSFVALDWKDAGGLESLAQAQVEVSAKQQGFTKNAKLGQVISDDVLPVRWLDAHSVLVTRAMHRSVHEEGKEESTAQGTARAVLRWNGKSRAFSMVKD